MALFTSDKNSEKVQKTEAVLEDAAKAQEEEQATTGKFVLRATGRLAGTFLRGTNWA